MSLFSRHLCVCFDYDYTLVHYSTNLKNLVYDLAKEHLVIELRYPESCVKFKYDHTFPIIGIYYDKLKGCLLKLDFFGSIELDGCYFGCRKLSCKDFIHVSYVENSFITYVEFFTVLQEYGCCFKNYLVKLTMRLHEELILEKTLEKIFQPPFGELVMSRPAIKMSLYATKRRRDCLDIVHESLHEMTRKTPSKWINHNQQAEMRNENSIE
uniref:Uncharacterized protein n=1 Tax=Cucumis melo TaxID=3656 RepID=A0A9I9EHK7_CUCME